MKSGTLSIFTLRYVYNHIVYVRNLYFLNEFRRSMAIKITVSSVSSKSWRDSKVKLRPHTSNLNCDLDEPDGSAGIFPVIDSW